MQMVNDFIDVPDAAQESGVAIEDIDDISIIRFQNHARNKDVCHEPETDSALSGFSFNHVAASLDVQSSSQYYILFVVVSTDINTGLVIILPKRSIDIYLCPVFL